MRTFLVIVILLISLGLSAQHSGITITPVPKIDKSDLQRPGFLDSLQKKLNFSSASLNPQASYSHSLPNGNTVYRLPQDNMPCVVPATTSNMPVIKKDNNGMMPNLTVPGTIIPKRQ